MKNVLTGVITRLGKLTVTALALALLAVASHGQGPEATKPLRLDGEVVRVTVERNGRSQVYYLTLRMRFTNISEKPVILLLGTHHGNKDWWILDTGFSLTLEDALARKPFYVSPMGPASSHGLPKWQKLRQQLSASRPPKVLTETVQPEETYSREIETLIVVNDGDGVLPGSRVWMYVFLELWPENIEPWRRPEGSLPYGESLRRRWQAFGELQLKPILSTPIPLELPPSPSTKRP